MICLFLLYDVGKGDPVPLLIKLTVACFLKQFNWNFQSSPLTSNWRRTTYFFVRCWQPKVLVLVLFFFLSSFPSSLRFLPFFLSSSIDWKGNQNSNGEHCNFCWQKQHENPHPKKQNILLLLLLLLLSRFLGFHRQRTTTAVSTVNGPSHPGSTRLNQMRCDTSNKHAFASFHDGSGHWFGRFESSIVQYKHIWK